MSDYLWDKTGEPDKDVERLEEMLGRFRHRARAPELTAEAAGRDAARTVAPRPLRPAWLAVAAALLVAFAAGALLLLLSRNASPVGGRQGRAEAAAQKSQAGTRATPDQQTSPREASVQQTAPPPVAAPGNGETTAGENEVVRHDEQSGPDEHGGRSLRGQERRRGGVGEVAAKQRGGEGVAGARRGAGEEVEGRATERTVAASPGEGREQREQTPEERGGQQALEERRRAAKDDLMYVLRLTGLKLKEVQKRTQKVDGWKSAFDQQK